MIMSVLSNVGLNYDDIRVLETQEIDKIAIAPYPGPTLSINFPTRATGKLRRPSKMCTSSMTQKNVTTFFPLHFCLAQIFCLYIHHHDKANRCVLACSSKLHSHSGRIQCVDYRGHSLFGSCVVERIARSRPHGHRLQSRKNNAQGRRPSSRNRR